MLACPYPVALLSSLILAAICSISPGETGLIPDSERAQSKTPRQCLPGLLGREELH